MIISKISKILVGLFFVFSSIILALTLKGHVGNPTAAELREPYWTSNGPFELSPERGRFALAYSMVNDKSVIFSLDLARFTTPDLGYKNGNYVSLFAPGVSFITSLGLMIGSYFGASQLGAFSMVAIIAILNCYLIYRLARVIGITTTSALLGAFTFLFATPAFVYGVTLYQHHFSTALILLSLNLLVCGSSWFSLFLVWLLCASSIPIDYPNAILMIPIALAALSRIVNYKKTKSAVSLNLKPYLLTTFISMIIPLGMFMWFNKESYGNPLQLSGTVASVARIDENGDPAPPERDFKILGEEYVKPDQQKKSVVRFFEPRDLINGFYTHLISRDRGILFFTPILIIALLGLSHLLTRNAELGVITVAISVIALIVYSLWGDPWGGWAFGSRYLIPAYAMLSLMIASALDHYRRNLIILFLTLSLGIYSIFTNTIGALGTIAIPPKVQVLSLEAITGRVERYSWDRSWEYIKGGKTKSAVYETHFSQYISPITYFYYIFGTLSLVYLLIMITHYTSHRRSK
ncbi:MAG: hypothetical protein Fur0011_6490 [Candidatus Microgenomates bacterium]